MTSSEDRVRFDWRRGGAAAGALVAILVLLFMVFLVAMSNQARDRALELERRAYDVALLTRAVDASVARAEAALGRFVLDEDQRTSGSLYYANWRLAGQQVRQLRRLLADDPQQRDRADDLIRFYNQRGTELADVARAAATGRGAGGTSLWYQASNTTDGPGPALRFKLDEIADSERDTLVERIRQTQVFAAEADRLTDYLSWLGIFVGFAAIFLGVVAVQAIRQFAYAKRQAEDEADRAETLEAAVAERTGELRAAYDALRIEAEERQAAEAQLRQVQKMEAVGQLTGGIAHDFNNMLAVVVGGIDLARRRLDGPRGDVLVHLTNAMEGATRAAALTRRLLSFARSEPLLPERVDSGELLSGMGDLLDRTLGERIQVETDLTPKAWPVYVDPHQLENAIVNLAVNARDAMDGTGRVRITTANMRLEANEVGDIQAGDYLKISVGDTGCGMSAEVIERAFEPFFTTKPVGKGTGLGLSQIFGFAHQSGGEVGIVSAPGKGTTVSIYLPRTDARRQSVQRPQVVDDCDLRVDGARILVVEDDPRVRASTMEALRDLGYDPVACGSGAEAIAAFEAERFDLVISDVVMPEMTGPELIRHLKARFDPFAVLFVTGYVGDGDTSDLVGHDLLRKPFTIGALAGAVVAALSRPPSGSHHSSGAAATG